MLGNKVDVTYEVNDAGLVVDGIAVQGKEGEVGYG